MPDANVGGGSPARPVSGAEHPGSLSPFAAHPDALPRPARRAAALTLAGLWWEQIARSFWLAASLAALAVAALALGLVEALPDGVLPWVALCWALIFCAAALAGWLRFRAPTAAQALARVDARLPGRPLGALGDRMALGGAGAQALWRAHLAQAEAAARQARAVAPDAGLSRRDPFALRLIGLTALALALIFGDAGPAGRGLTALAGAWKPAARPVTETPAAGPSWEGWAEPPRYTRRPTIYLNALKDDALTIPEGGILSFRLYGEGMEIAQDVGEPVADGNDKAAPSDAGGAGGAAADGSGKRDKAGPQDASDLTRQTASAQASPPDAPRFVARQTGTIRVGGRSFAVTVLPDDAPTVQLSALADRRADGRMAQGFSAADDNGIARGQAVIALDLAAIDRRYGLAPDPEARAALTLDLPLPGAGQRRRVNGTLAADLARHPWANLPVTISLTVEDGIGQTGATAPVAMILPGRRFFDPLAAGLVEIRRDLLWSRDNAARSAQLLRAMVWRPDRPVPPDAAAAVVAAVGALEAGPLTPKARDALADSLWDAAVKIEDGGVNDALARMRQAQERLSQAIRNGASPDEIQKLMDALKAATDAYTEALAQQGEDPAARFDRSEQQSRQITGDQLQQMMDEIQRLMNEGRMAEAQELLQQFNRLMENLQVREGGQGGSGSRPMQRLGETLREQQRLADEAQREAQRAPFGQGMDPETGAQPGEGQPGADGQDGEGQSGTEDGEGASLADRQRSLREELGRQRGLMPGRGTPEGDAAGRALDNAGRAMSEAEQALRQGDPAGALDRQAAAIEALRQGMRALGRIEQAQRGPSGEDGAPQPGAGEQPGQQGSRQANGGEGDPDGRPQRDPLGRESGGQGGNITTGEALADTERDAGRARDLQDEIRRRSGERARPQGERDYLGRLLDRF